VNGGATRRSVLAASLTAPLLAAAGCGAPAAATPPPGSDVAILRAAIAAKKNMISLYLAVRALHPELAGQLDPLLADNNAHLAELQRRLIEPAHRSAGRTGGRSPSPAPGNGNPAAALAALQSAERTAAAVHVGQLRTVTPSLAQLLASIAACEATHAAALTKGSQTL
jgi:hypothetical protein